MIVVSRLFVGLVALIHCYILWFEMFAWKERGPGVFSSFPPELFAHTEVLAANQGLYNGFLAAGLIWSLCIRDSVWSRNVAAFFLICVGVAGVYGAFSAELRILYVQTVPAVLGLISIFFAHRVSNSARLSMTLSD
ncbi:MAG: DUF1304 domain-containing protein [Pseudomonadales bacterium]